MCKADRDVLCCAVVLDKLDDNMLALGAGCVIWAEEAGSK